jgi:hypothetical protein
MIPYAIDPSLHSTEPEPPQLDDGFSPPETEEVVEPEQAAPVLGDISPF